MRRIASTNTRSFARASAFTSTTTLSSSSSAASLSLPLHRRFTSSEDNKQQKQQDDQQQSSGSGFLMKLVGAAALATGVYYTYKESMGEPVWERKKAAPVAQEGKKEKEAAAAEVKPSPPVSLNKDEFREFELVEVEDLTPNTRRLRFALPSRDHVLGLPVASCVVTKANIGAFRMLANRPNISASALIDSISFTAGENGKPVIRPYTPVTNDKSDKGYFDFIIKVRE